MLENHWKLIVKLTVGHVSLCVIARGVNWLNTISFLSISTLRRPIRLLRYKHCKNIGNTEFWFIIYRHVSCIGLNRAIYNILFDFQKYVYILLE